MALKVKQPQVQPDPELEAATAAAKRDKLQSIQDSVSADTDRLARLYGTRNAMAGSKMGAPILGY